MPIPRGSNRREFLLTVLKTAGAAAALAALDTEHLLAIPPAVSAEVGWAWDGSAISYLTELNRLFAYELQRRRLRLPVVPDVEYGGHGDLRAAGFEAICQVNVGWELPEDWRLGGAGGYRAPHPDEELVARGRALYLHRADPVRALPQLASQFAQQVQDQQAEAYLTMVLPNEDSARVGPFRMVSQYDVRTDVFILRLDLMLARRIT